MVMRTGSTHLPGIGRTALELAKALDELHDPGIDIRLLTQTFRGHIPHCFTNLKITNLLWPIGRKYDWLKQMTPLLDLAAPHDLLYEPANFAKVYRPDNTVVTIHDAMFFSYPEDFLGHNFSRTHVPGFARSCCAIATPSLASKSDIVHYLGVPPEKVTVIPWGVDRTVFNPTDKQAARTRVTAETGINRPYFLAVSCNIGRKNTITVLKAFKAALRKGFEHTLVLVWGSPPAEYLQEFVEEVAKGQIVFLKHVPDDLLGDLYRGATASFFPSRYEGFGLPILESMACGTPVVTCRNSSLSEVGGAAALYVEPDDIDGMADLMRQFETSSALSAEHGEQACLTQAAKFDWHVCAAHYLAFYKQHAQV